MLTTPCNPSATDIWKCFAADLIAQEIQCITAMMAFINGPFRPVIREAEYNMWAKVDHNVIYLGVN